MSLVAAVATVQAVLLPVHSATIAEFPCSIWSVVSGKITSMERSVLP